MTVETKTTVTLTEDERKTLEDTQDILTEICDSVMDCTDCPLMYLCGTKFSATNTINNLIDLLN